MVATALKFPHLIFCFNTHGIEFYQGPLFFCYNCIPLHVYWKAIHFFANASRLRIGRAGIHFHRVESIRLDRLHTCTKLHNFDIWHNKNVPRTFCDKESQARGTRTHSHKPCTRCVDPQSWPKFTTRIGHSQQRNLTSSRKSVNEKTVDTKRSGPEENGKHKCLSGLFRHAIRRSCTVVCNCLAVLYLLL